ncbi:25220_t:CDS:2 [Gigaspora margarita]|uniref:25220_t:CDS:1 n=1 Tax=Gigaspora margarita TaxID=4874 RepID=A0ABN7VAE2_GIGMA|nr:25220_t:CDS:2 [Gigaspora margarita]
MYPTMALLQQQITGTSQPEKCINKGSNNEIIEKLTGLMEQIADNLGDYVEVENNEANEENANKDDKPRKLVKKKRKSSESKETDDEEEWKTEDDEEYQDEHLINKTYLYQEIYDESNNFLYEYYLENQTNNTKEIEDKNFNLDNMNEKQKQLIKNLLLKYKDVFAWNSSELGKTTVV